MREFEENIRCVIVEPGKKPEVKMIPNTYKALVSIVGGYIECVGLDEKSDLICNDEGKLIGLPPNRRVGNDIIAGTFLIVGVEENNDQFVSLDENQCEQYTKMFDEIEQIDPAEIEKCLRFTFIPM